MPSAILASRSGSPPRTRGGGRQRREPTLQRRITPAYAGRRRRRLRDHLRCTDHPRVRGEERVVNAGSLPVCGSPPRTRGGGPHRRPHLRERGITPAYAGRRRRGRWGAGSVADHPRVRGEESADARRYPLGVGSPPRTRGGGPRGEKLPLGGRITPAYAGRSRPRSAMSPPARDHPRVRGEEQPGLAGQAFYAGSPPRTRGGDPCGCAGVALQRITPAYAGRRTSRRP